MTFRRFVHRLLYLPPVKAILSDLPVIQRLYPVWERRHPIDAAYGIDTGGFVPVEDIHADRALTALINPYGPSQPSVVRRALAALGDVSEYTFVDMGCGKGRVTILAGEFDFRKILGLELSPSLAAAARANAGKIGQLFPDRTAIEIIEANALTFPYPDQKLALFMYHSFGREILSGLIQKLANRREHLFFIYYNPVHGDLLDGSPAFQRWYAECLACEQGELAFGPDKRDTVVIWQSIADAVDTPHLRVNRPIFATQPGLKADVEI